MYKSKKPSNFREFCKIDVEDPQGYPNRRESGGIIDVLKDESRDFRIWRAKKGAWLDSARSARSVQLIRYQLIGKVEFNTINQKLMKSNPSFYLLTF